MIKKLSFNRSKIDRPLPKIAVGDILVLHDAGAHGRTMGFNYNGRRNFLKRRWQNPAYKESRNRERLFCDTKLFWF